MDPHRPVDTMGINSEIDDIGIYKGMPQSFHLCSSNRKILKIAKTNHWADTQKERDTSTNAISFAGIRF